MDPNQCWREIVSNYNTASARYAARRYDAALEHANEARELIDALEVWLGNDGFWPDGCDAQHLRGVARSVTFLIDDCHEAKAR